MYIIFAAGQIIVNPPNFTYSFVEYKWSVLSRRVMLIISAILWLSVFDEIYAASFECNNATTLTEKSICATPGLSGLDDVLEKDYLHALDVSADKDAILATQRAWLKGRDKCGNDSNCILNAYQKRLKELRLCDMRTTETERLVCNTTNLWALDRLVEREYQQALEQATDKESLIEDYKVWIEERDRCRVNLRCLRESYEKRILILRGEYYPLTKDIPKRPYVLEKGQGVEVCEAYQDNLNSQHTKVPWVCDRPINTALPGFEQQPEWQRNITTPKGNAVYSLYREMGNLLWTRDVNPAYYHTVSEYPNWLGTAAQLVDARKGFDLDRENLWLYFPYIAELDVDNDGSNEAVYFEQPCSSVFGSRLAVLTADWQRIDRVKTEKLMLHPAFKRTGRDVFRPLFKGERDIIYAEKFGYKAIEDAWHYLYYDVFIYRDKVYFDQWWSHHPDFSGGSDMDAGRLRVFQATPEATMEVCTYRFYN